MIARKKYEILKGYLERKVEAFNDILSVFIHEGSAEKVEYRQKEIIAYEYAREFFESEKKEKSIKAFLRMIRVMKDSDMDIVLSNSVFIYTDISLSLHVFPYEKLRKNRNTVIVNYYDSVLVTTKNWDEVSFDEKVPIEILSGYGLPERIISLLKDNGVDTIDIFDSSVKKIKGISNGSLKKIRRAMVSYFGKEE